MVAASSDSIHVGTLQNAFGAIAVGRGAIAINFSFGLIQRVVIGKDGGDVAFDPRAEVSRPPLTPPHPHGMEPELGNLIGRHAELQALLGLFQQTCTGNHGATVWITGESGMGRNALGRRFVQLVEDAEPAPDLHRRTFTLLTLSGRFWIDPDPQQQALEPRTQDVWGEWSNYIRRSFPRSSAAAGPTWISLMSQLAATNEGRGVPPGLRDEPASLLAFLRQCLQDCDAGVLTLENMDEAPDVWIPLLEGLAREAVRDLKLVLVATIRADRPIQDLVEDAQTPLQHLALRVCRLEIASSVWLGPIDYAEFENCFPGTDESVRQALYRLTGGAPLWLEAMWEDWKSRNQVERDRGGSWYASADFAGGNARLYAEYLIRRVLDRRDSDFEFTDEELRQVLCTAALEGPTFTLEAVAEATDFHPDDLADFFASELSGPAGLVKAEPGVRIEQKESGLLRDLRRFRFEPLGSYYVFLQYPAETERRAWAYRLCDVLERAYWPFPDRLHLGLGRLFALGGSVDPDGKLLPKRQAERNQRMAYYGLIGRHLDETELTQREVEFWRDAGDDPVTQYRLLGALYRLARRLETTGPLAKANEVAVEGVNVAEILGAEDLLAVGLFTLGRIEKEQGQYEAAREQIGRALALREQLGNIGGQAICLLALGQIDQDQGRYEPAREQIGRALMLFKQLGDIDGQAVSSLTLGQIDIVQGQNEAAREQIGRSLAIFEQLGDIREQANCLLSLGQNDITQGQYEAAREQIGRALVLYEQLGHNDGQASCLALLGQIDRAQGQYEVAREQIGRALVLYEQLGHNDHLSFCLLEFGRIDRDQGRYEAAREQIGRALALNEHLGDVEGQASCLLALGQLEIVLEDTTGACRELKRARVLFDQVGASDRVEEVNAELRKLPGCAA